MASCANPNKHHANHLDAELPRDDENGTKPRFGQVIGRTLCRFVPFEAFSFFGERGWHDKIPKTRVVMARD